MDIELLSPNDLENLTIILSGLILGLRLANEGQRYLVTASLIGWLEA